ncbi:MAG: tetratricopeptide repeat protein [Sulfurihydrogenibium sp.]|jgi:type IV pilus assembly protein PilF|nr:tetratricopeptide repeat protein [Sulfurihydrogenibium sp.]
MKKVFFALTLAILISSCASPQLYESDLKVADGKYLYEMGISYLNSGNNAMAIKYLEEALKSYDKPEVYNALALAYQFAGEFAKAEGVFRLGIDKYPDYPELLTNYGILLASQKKFDEAIKYFEKAINNPTYSGKEKAYYNLGMVYLQLGKEDLFLYNLEKALMFNSNFVNAYIALGDYYLDKYNAVHSKEILKKAREYYSRALNYVINDPLVYFRLGRVYHELGDDELAKYYLEKALRSAENNTGLKEEIRKYLLEILDKPKPKINLNEEIKKTSSVIEDKNNNENRILKYVK